MRDHPAKDDHTVSSVPRACTPGGRISSKLSLFPDSILTHSGNDQLQNKSAVMWYFPPSIPFSLVWHRSKTDPTMRTTPLSPSSTNTFSSSFVSKMQKGHVEAARWCHFVFCHLGLFQLQTNQKYLGCLKNPNVAALSCQFFISLQSTEVASNHMYPMPVWEQKLSAAFQML